MEKVLTQQDFLTFKQEVLDKKIGRKKIALSDLKLLTEDVVQYAGLNFVLTRQAFKSLCRISGISQKLRENLIKQYGADFAEKMLHTLTKVMSSSKQNIVALIDMNKKTILNFVTTETEMVPNSSFINSVEQIISDNNLNLNNFSLNDDGSFIVNVLGDKSQWGLRGIENQESFEFGLSFSNSPIGGTKMAPFNKRLICSNGMINTNFSMATIITNSKDSWDNYYKTVDILQKTKFKPTEFEPRLQRVMNSQASISEVISARNILKANSKIDDDSVERFAPILNTEIAYKKIGINIETLNNSALKNAKTDVGYWDLINGLTDFASHNYGFEVTKADNIQKFAGRLFSDEPDLGNLVPDPFRI